MPNKFPIEKKISIVKEFNDGANAAKLAKANGVHIASIYQWAKDLKAKAVHKKIEKTGPAPSSNPDTGPRYIAYLKEENDMLKRMYGELSINYERLRVMYNKKLAE